MAGGINWGQLSPIAAPQVIGALPQQAPQPGAVDVLGSGLQGLAQGYAQGQGIQMNQQGIEMNDMKLQQMKQAVQDDQQLRGAGTPDKWMQILAKQGKFDEVLKYQTQQELYQNALLNNKASLLELNEKERNKADRDNIINVQVMGTISQLPADQRQAAYQQYRVDLNKKYPDIIMPQEFNENTFASVMRTNEIMQATQQQQLTEKVATLHQLQKDRATLSQAKAMQIAANKPTDLIDKELKETQDLINTHTRNVQTQAQDKTQEEANKKKIEVSAEGLKTAQKAAKMAANIEPVLDQLDSILDKTSNKVQGPIIGYVGEIMSENVQEIESKQGLVTSMLRQLMEFPAAGFSDADREMLSKIGASKFKDKTPNKNAVRDLRLLLQKAKDNLSEYQAEYDAQFGTKSTSPENKTAAPVSMNPIEEQMRKRGLLD